MPAMSGPRAHVARQGFECTVGRGYEDEAWGSATVDTAGQVVRANWEWRVSVPGAEGWLRVGAIGFVEGARPIRAEDGSATVSWANGRSGDRPPLLRLEVTSVGEGRAWPEAPFAGAYERSGDHLYSSNWADFSSFARGAAQLFVLLRDREGHIVARAKFDPAVIVRGTEQVGELLGTLRDKIAHFREQCAPTDDVDPQIVVTSLEQSGFMRT
jgi:hypothetical protein